MNLVPRQTAELQGPALDWAVAHATKAWEWAHEWFPTMTLDATFRGVSDDVKTYGCVVLLPRNPMRQDFQEFCPAREWAYGGRLIEKYNVSLFAPPSPGDYWGASIWTEGKGRVLLDGPTARIAACRAIVASQLGATVQIPEELA